MFRENIRGIRKDQLNNGDTSSLRGVHDFLQAAESGRNPENFILNVLTEMAEDSENAPTGTLLLEDPFCLKNRISAGEIVENSGIPSNYETVKDESDPGIQERYNEKSLGALFGTLYKIAPEKVVAHELQKRKSYVFKLQTQDYTQISQILKEESSEY